MSAKRGRPLGHVRLFDDPGRFEIAAWLAFTEAGMKPYPAAYLVSFLLASNEPITTEGVDGALDESSSALKSTTTLVMRTIAGHADRIRRKAPQAIERADERELAWLEHSSGLIVALLRYTAEGNQTGLRVTLSLLRKAGWADTILRVSARIDASLPSGNFPPAKGL